MSQVGSAHVHETGYGSTTSEDSYNHGFAYVVEGALGVIAHGGVGLLSLSMTFKPGAARRLI